MLPAAMSLDRSKIKAVPGEKIIEALMQAWVFASMRMFMFMFMRTFMDSSWLVCVCGPRG
jgi:hypothetical protein